MSMLGSPFNGGAGAGLPISLYKALGVCIQELDDIKPTLAYVREALGKYLVTIHPILSGVFPFVG
jgi:hypothetical protein